MEEEGEILNTEASRGEKRNSTALEEEDFEETLSIKPPPVSNKKHKRHKKHKTNKDDKKRKHGKTKSEDGNENDKDLTSNTKDIESKHRGNDYSDSLIRRSPDQSDSWKRDRSHRQSDTRAHDRSKSHEYKSREGDRPRSGGYPSRGYRADHDRPRDDRFPRPRDDRGIPSRPRPGEDARSRINSRRELAKHKAPLIVRQYDDANKQRKDKVDEKNKHERSISSSVVVTGNRKVEAGEEKRNSLDETKLKQQRMEVRRISPQGKKLEILKKNKDIVEEIVSSENSSDSSASSDSESENEKPEVEEQDEEEETNIQDESATQSDEETAASSSNSSSAEEVGESANSEDDESASEESGDESAEMSAEEEDPSSRFDSPGKDDRLDEDEEHNDEDANTPEHEVDVHEEIQDPELPFYLPAIQGCRSVDEFQCLNRIEEGTYGVVYRAKDKKTDNVVALKRLKMEKEREGFPITSLREVCTLLKAHHPNCVRVQEIVVGSNVDKIYIVMDYVEHDLKSLMETMKQPFLTGEVKTLMIQLLQGVHHLHDNWILHRDLKTSNLLLSHRGILKIGDFGLAREYGSPLKPYTPIVVTLWYRCPELLLGAKEYSTAVDMWSVGCIFAEFLNKKPLFPGKSETMQLNLIFKELGTPSEKIWPGYNDLPIVKKTTFVEYPYNTLRKRFGATDISQKGFDLLNRFLTYSPERRISAYNALKHDWFLETPKPVEPSMFPTWPAKSELDKKRAGPAASSPPKAPAGAMGYSKLINEEEKLGFQLTAPKHGISKQGMGFSLKF
uniref:cyclin-dependent kinase 11B isoform X2 n=1 Tax=Ciona intestinalis TaxID=7719 RepID=UPI000EF5417F|nr:cyclin-dependent kinase 11B isoform X2 [Ciona intestinalis]|eukprot:XP_026695142.1 cyclin-dependent kinase 11B isoform X2 [Ciona intestinalis]